MYTRNTYHRTANHIFFPDLLKRQSFQKKLRLNMIFLVLLEKMIFLFPENMTLPLRWKMKDDLSQKKIHGNVIFSANVLKRLSFQKAPREITFPVLSGKMVFFPNTLYFFLGRKVRDDLSQEKHGNMMFSVDTYGC